MQRAFYIGRFQPFHNGHAQVIEGIVAEVDELVVGIGSADASHSLRNPFTAGERVEMVADALEAIDVPTYVIPIVDIDRNSLWVSHVESMCPPFDVAYSNNPLVVRLFTEAGVEVRRSPMFNRDVLEGTGLRRRMIEGEPWTEHVPEPVAAVIERIDGVERLRQVNADDAA